MNTKPTGKGKKAHDRLKVIDSQVEEIISKLKTVQIALNGIIGKEEGAGEKRTQGKGAEKNRSAVKDTPARIEFWKGRLSFYIDFTLAASDSEGMVNVEGCIVYGVSRRLCFAKCIFSKEKVECENCDRITRCDGLEDKPLVKFSVSRHGIIRSSGELDNQWRIDTGDEGTATAIDLHYCALDHVWEDALNWTNENILP